MLRLGPVVVALLPGLGLQLSLTMKLLLFTSASQLLLEVLLGLLLVLLKEGGVLKWRRGVTEDGKDGKDGGTIGED